MAVPAVHIGFEALCADPDVDLVDVVTRPSRHRMMASAALADTYVKCISGRDEINRRRIEDALRDDDLDAQDHDYEDY